MKTTRSNMSALCALHIIDAAFPRIEARRVHAHYANHKKDVSVGASVLAHDHAGCCVIEGPVDDVNHWLSLVNGGRGAAKLCAQCCTEPYMQRGDYWVTLPKHEEDRRDEKNHFCSHFARHRARIVDNDDGTSSVLEVES